MDQYVRSVPARLPSEAYLGLDNRWQPYAGSGVALQLPHGNARPFTISCHNHCQRGRNPEATWAACEDPESAFFAPWCPETTS